MPIRNLFKKLMPKKSTSVSKKSAGGGSTAKKTSKPKRVVRKAASGGKVVAKKAVKKASPKKVVAKKSVPKKTAKKMAAPKKVRARNTVASSKKGKPAAMPPIKVLENCYMQACGPDCFWFSCGYVVKDVYELHDVLAQLKDDDYNYHVGQEKNDFANWINDVLGEETLAEDLTKVNSRQDAVSVLRMYIY